MTWRLAVSLETLRFQLDALYPNRSKVSDGSIGDQAHAARNSDHNPNAAGVVTAIDITHDPVNGPDGHQLSRQLIKDARVKYVIFGGEIWKARTKEWEVYRGLNRHEHHVHISVEAIVCDDRAPWVLDGDPPPAAVRLPTLQLTVPPTRNWAVKLLQEELTQHGFAIGVDGIFGFGTQSVVKKFQASKGLKDDGIVGQNTWEKLGEK